VYGLVNLSAACNRHSSSNFSAHDPNNITLRHKSVSCLPVLTPGLLLPLPLFFFFFFVLHDFYHFLFSLHPSFLSFRYVFPVRSFFLGVPGTPFLSLSPFLDTFFFYITVFLPYPPLPIGLFFPSRSPDHCHLVFLCQLFLTLRICPRSVFFLGSPLPPSFCNSALFSSLPPLSCSDRSFI